MSTINSTREQFREDLHPSTPVDLLSGAERPFGGIVDLFICEHQQRPPQDSQADEEQIPLDEVVREFEAQPPDADFFGTKHPHSTKRSREATAGATHLGMEHHGGKPTGTKSSIRAFEHRWPHLRDRAEGRNHRLPSN